MNPDITGNTGLICLLGSPVKHSLSPMMHNLSFQLTGLDYVYLCFETGEDDLEQVVSGLKAMNARGFNLTMPNKTKVISLCDHLSPAASLIGAANTVVNDHGILTGHNTDGVGYMQSLKAEGFDAVGKKITLLGGGGAASAILVQAALDGVAEISVFVRPTSRFCKRTKEIVARLQKETCSKIRIFDFNDRNTLKKELLTSDLLTNATSVGMAPAIDASPVPDASYLPDHLFVSDVIYHPEKTKLLQMADEKGLKTANGKLMLLYQGAEAFRLWTGKEMPVDEVKKKYWL